MRSIAEQPEPAGKTFEEHFAEINARLAAIRLNVMRYDAAAMQPAAKLPVAEAFFLPVRGEVSDPDASAGSEAARGREQALRLAPVAKMAKPSRVAFATGFRMTNMVSPGAVVALGILLALLAVSLFADAPAPNGVQASAETADAPQLGQASADSVASPLASGDIAPDPERYAVLATRQSNATLVLPTEPPPWWGAVGARSFVNLAPSRRYAAQSEADAVEQALLAYRMANGTNSERLYTFTAIGADTSGGNSTSAFDPVSFARGSIDGDMAGRR